MSLDEKMSRKLGHLIHTEAERFVDDFLRLTLQYSDETSEIRKMINAPEAEQQTFLFDLRKAATLVTPDKKEIRKAGTPLTIPDAAKIFSNMLNKQFTGWSSQRGVRPEGFYTQELKEDLKKKKHKEKRKA